MRGSNRTRRSPDSPARSPPAAAAGTLPNTNVAHAEFPLTRAGLYPDQRVFIAHLGRPSTLHRNPLIAGSAWRPLTPGRPGALSSRGASRRCEPNEEGGGRALAPRRVDLPSRRRCPSRPGTHSRRDWTLVPSSPSAHRRRAPTTLCAAGSKGAQIPDLESSYHEKKDAVAVCGDRRSRDVLGRSSRSAQHPQPLSCAARPAPT